VKVQIDLDREVRAQLAAVGDLTLEIPEAHQRRSA
jgi:hypothetical protein